MVSNPSRFSTISLLCTECFIVLSSTVFVLILVCTEGKEAQLEYKRVCCVLHFFVIADVVPMIHLWLVFFFPSLAFGHVISIENFSPKSKTTVEDIILLLGSVLTWVVPVGVDFSHYQYDIQLEIRLVGIFHSPMHHISFSWLVCFVLGLFVGCFFYLFYFITFKWVIATGDFREKMSSK